VAADWGERWRRLQGEALFRYSRLTMRTARYRVDGQPNMEAAEQSGRPVLWSLWHQQVMLFVSFGDRFLENENFVALTVGDERGDTLGAFAERLGGRAHRVDMQGNPFAAGRAVLRVIRDMNEGRHSVLAPDGPDGPAYVPKPGIAFLARKAEAAVLPCGLWTRQAYQIDRWDRYLVPLPFARIHVAIGPPIYAERRMDQDDLLRQISDALHKTRTRAQVLAGVRPWR
jgi:lysophospholipid acyltransferase (LPLAT)-like uncharacterized protein